ncbi:MAG: AtpZ/AtpI family protein [Ignavibacteria bacterium]|nr:AtpZ/AtpI family protein [Ignavibacteria bacterium]
MLNPKKVKDEQRKFIEGFAKSGPYLGLGAQMAATVVIMVFLGKYLDDYLNSSPAFILIFSLLGSFAAIYNFIRQVLRLNEKKKNGNN